MVKLPLTCILFADFIAIHYLFEEFSNENKNVDFTSFKNVLVELDIKGFDLFDLFR